MASYLVSKSEKLYQSLTMPRYKNKFLVLMQPISAFEAHGNHLYMVILKVKQDVLDIDILSNLESCSIEINLNAASE